VHGYTTAFEVSALLVAMAAVVAGVLVGTRRNHEVSAGYESVERTLEFVGEEV
jgi:uncharacterized protein YoxC